MKVIKRLLPDCFACNDKERKADNLQCTLLFVGNKYEHTKTDTV